MRITVLRCIVLTDAWCWDLVVLTYLSLPLMEDVVVKMISENLCEHWYTCVLQQL